MSSQEQFEEFKAKAINGYLEYIEAIKQVSYEDLQLLNNRIILVKAYHKAVIENSWYRHFIHTHSLKYLHKTTRKIKAENSSGGGAISFEKVN